MAKPDVAWGELSCFHQEFWRILVGFTLSPIIMDMETGGLEDAFSLQGGHFPLP